MSLNYNSPDNRDVDLSEVSKRISLAYQGFLSWIFRGFLFIKRNVLILALLIIIGGGLGFYLDKKTTVFNHEIIVLPNFGSTSYLYSRVNLIKAKVNEGDKDFLQSIGISDPKVFSNIEVKPITDIYNLVGQSERNFELVKLMAEDADMGVIVEDKTTSLNYPYHTIKITTNKKVGSKDVIEAILRYLNESDYFKAIQKSVIESTLKGIRSDEMTVSQIDSLLSNFSSTSKSKGDKLVYFNNENTQLNDILKTKIDLNKDIADKKVELINMEKIVRDRSVVKNIRNNKSINGKLKFIIPMLFIGFYLLFGITRAFYRAQMKKINS